MTSQPSTHFSILRAACVTGGATLLSRILGFVRDVMIAIALGAGPLADIFVVVFRLPNVFRRLFAEGAFSAAFIPVFAKRLEGEGIKSARILASEVFAVLLVALLVVTVLAEIFMPSLVYILAPGFKSDADKFNQTVYYARIAFPYLICMSLMAVFVGMLNTTGRFFLVGLMPVLLNVILIAALGLAWFTQKGNQYVSLDYLIWGAAFAGVAQLVVLWLGAQHAGLSISIGRPRLSPDVKRILIIGVPGILAASVSQINLIIGTNIVSVQQGAAAWLYYADRLYQLPLGVIGMALSVVLLPDIVRRLRAGDKLGAVRSQNDGMIYALFLTLPSSFGLFVLADPMMSILFERGSFTAEDSHAAALALKGFALGLPAFVLIKILQPSFFAREDMRTPLMYGMLGVAVNVILSLLYFPVYGHVVIAVATSVSGWVIFLAMMIHLSLTGWHINHIFLGRFGLIGLASLGMFVVIMWFATYLSPAFSSSVVGLLLQIGLAICVYCGLLFGLTLLVWHRWFGDIAQPRWLNLLKRD